MNFSGWNNASSASSSRSSRASVARRPDVAGQHPGPLDRVERAVEGTGDGGVDEALAQADAELAAGDLDDGLGGRRVGPLEQVLQQPGLCRGTAGRLDRLECGRYLRQRRAAGRIRRVAMSRQHVLDGEAQVGVAVVGRAEVCRDSRRSRRRPRR